MVKELIEASKTYGREFTLLLVVMSAFGVAMKVVWENNTERLNQQDIRIDKADEFIRTELTTLHMESLEVTRKATDVMDRATSVMGKATSVMEAAVTSLERSTRENDK